MSLHNILIGFAFIIFGGIHVFQKDAAWKLQEYINRLKGSKSERTETWGNSAGCAGWLLMGWGVFILIYAVAG